MSASDIIRSVMWRVEDMALAGRLLFDPPSLRGFRASSAAWDAATGADMTAAADMYALIEEVLVSV